MYREWGVPQRMQASFFDGECGGMIGARISVCASNRARCRLSIGDYQPIPMRWPHPRRGGSDGRLDSLSAAGRARAGVSSTRRVSGDDGLTQPPELSGNPVTVHPVNLSRPGKGSARGRELRRFT